MSIKFKIHTAEEAYPLNIPFFGRKVSKSVIWPLNISREFRHECQLILASSCDPPVGQRPPWLRVCFDIVVVRLVHLCGVEIE